MSLNKYWLLAALAACILLTACNQPVNPQTTTTVFAAEPAQPTVTAAAATNDTALDQPIEDTPPARYVAPPTGQVVHMPQPDPGYGPIPDDSQLAIKSVELAKQLFRKAAAGNGFGNYPNQAGLSFDAEAGLTFGSYPTFTDYTCSFDAGAVPSCGMGAATEISAVEIVKDLPYLLNSDILDHGDRLRCNLAFCIDGETGRPLARIQPEMAQYMKAHFHPLGEGKFSVR